MIAPLLQPVFLPCCSLCSCDLLRLHLISLATSFECSLEGQALLTRASQSRLQTSWVHLYCGCPACPPARLPASLHPENLSSTSGLRWMWIAEESGKEIVSFEPRTSPAEQFTAFKVRLLGLCALSSELRRLSVATGGWLFQGWAKQGRRKLGT